MFANGKEVFVTDIWRYEKISNGFADNLYYNIILEQMDDKEFMTLKDYAVRLADAVGISIGPIHAEIKLCNGEPVMIEIASRFCGSNNPYYIRKYSSFDPINSTIEVYVNGFCEVQSPIKFNGHIVIARESVNSMGVVKKITGLDRIYSLQSYQNHILSIAEDEFVKPSTSLVNMPLVVWLAHEDKEILINETQVVHECFSIEVEECLI